MKIVKQNLFFEWKLSDAIFIPKAHSISNAKERRTKTACRLRSDNKKSSANKLAKSYDSSKSQTSKTAPQPTPFFGIPPHWIYII